MRGGAIPFFVWGTILAVLGTICWVWTDDAIQVGTFAFAVTVIWGGGMLLGVSTRDAVRRGPPAPADEPEAVPSASAGAALAALAVAAIVFGLAFGRFLMYFGAGLLVIAIGLLTIERSQQRRARRDWMERSGR